MLNALTQKSYLKHSLYTQLNYFLNHYSVPPIFYIPLYEKPYEKLFPK